MVAPGHPSHWERVAHVTWAGPQCPEECPAQAWTYLWDLEYTHGPEEEDMPDFEKVADGLRLWAASIRNPDQVGLGKKGYSLAHRKPQGKLNSQMHRGFNDIIRLGCHSCTCLPLSWLHGLPLEKPGGSCRQLQREDLGPS